MVPTNHGEKPGALEVVREANALMVETGKGMLCIDWLKPAGKNEMSSAEFIRGYLRQ
jgi:methionyl-tRNA formyltransferase